MYKMKEGNDSHSKVKVKLIDSRYEIPTPTPPHRPHREDLLHQVSPSGQWTPGVFILRSHSKTVEPGEQRAG